MVCGPIHFCPNEDIEVFNQHQVYDHLYTLLYFKFLGLEDFYDPDSDILTSDTWQPVGWGDSNQERPGPEGGDPLIQNKLLTVFFDKKNS